MENNVVLLDDVASPWTRVLEYIREKCNDFGLAILDAIGFDGIHEGYANLVAPDEFRATWLNSHYGDLLRGAFSAVVGSSFVDYRITLAKEKAVVRLADPKIRVVAKPETPSVPRPKLYAHYTFDTFVKGDCNSTALLACETVAENPGDKSLNPLFVYGASGLGKTHLLHAIASKVIKAKASAKVVYVSSRDFLNDFVAMFKSGCDRHKMEQIFVDRYERSDLLLIDDIQLLEKSTKAKERLFLLIRYMRSVGRQVVLTSDCHPAKMPQLSVQLVHSIDQCVSVGLDAPDLNTRIGLISRKSAQIPFVDKDREEICRYLSITPRQNVRLIEGMLTWLGAMHALNHVNLDLDCVKKLMNGSKEGKLIALTLESISETVAFGFNTDMVALKSKRQDSKASLPRKVAMYLCRELTSESLKKVGDLFNRDYATVISSIKSVQTLLEEDQNLARQVRDIRYMLGV
ncbi:MAG: ATP-binding protein [Fibrobacteraceae bacterium]|nr:ATP-binding protein [Fibrobacteraceae bacterium]